MDAGFCSTDNIEEMFSLEIAFMTRLQSNKNEFKELALAYGLYLLEDEGKAIDHKDKVFYIQKVERKFGKYDGFAYICYDSERRVREVREWCATYKTLEKPALTEEENKEFKENSKKRDKILNDLNERIEKFTNTKTLRFFSCGLFVLVSNTDLDIEDVLATYYERNEIELMFSFLKGDCG
jgi:transposase